MHFFDQSKNFKFVILFFLLVNFLVFFNSKKILLWQEKTGELKNNIFYTAVLFSANYYENLKEKLGLKEFFNKEHFFWLKLKNSPIIFANINPRQTENDIIQQETIQQKNDTTLEEEPSLKVPQIIPEEISREENIIEKQENQKTAPGDKKFSLEKEMRILVVGDSMVAAGGGLGEMLEKELKKEFPNAKILREGKVSSGLSRPDYFNWEARLGELIFQFQPSIAIFAFGLNDAQALTSNNGSIVVPYTKFGQKRWEEEYGERIKKMIEISLENNIFVFWIGLPIVRDTSLSNKLAFVNQIYDKEIRKFDNAVFIPIWCILCDNGKYTDYLYDENSLRKLVRTSDGIHLQYFGGRIVSHVIVKEIKDALNL